MTDGHTTGALHIHLDPLGGIAGDMFVAAILDAFPEWLGPVRRCLDVLDLGSDAECRLVAHNDGTLVGHRFLVGGPADVLQHDHGAPRHRGARHHHGHAHAADAKTADDKAELDLQEPPVRQHDTRADHHAHDGHAHRRWRDIRTLLETSQLPGEVKQHAIAIFRLLAEAEGRVHGMAEDDVTFHEIGAIDSICDIVAASRLIALLNATWSTAPLPLGSGRVRTAHGPLPVPAPATALLLRGLPTIDDGLPGERVTPTGAAIVRYLRATPSSRSVPRVLERTGTGFGLRTIPGISNCLRVLASREAEKPLPRASHRELAVIEFDVDDQTPEDLSIGLDRIRALKGIHDVVQFVGIGKKGRSFVHIRVLAAPAILDEAIDACFAETTTIGLRYHLVNGTALPRVIETVDVDGRRIRVKRVERPGGRRTAKAEIDDVAGELSQSERNRLRARAESQMLGPRQAGDDTTGGNGNNS